MCGADVTDFDRAVHAAWPLSGRLMDAAHPAWAMDSRFRASVAVRLAEAGGAGWARDRLSEILSRPPWEAAHLLVEPLTRGS